MNRTFWRWVAPVMPFYILGILIGSVVFGPATAIINGALIACGTAMVIIFSQIFFTLSMRWFEFCANQANKEK